MTEKLDVDTLTPHAPSRPTHCRPTNGRTGEEEVGFGWMGLGFNPGPPGRCLGEES